MTAQIITFPGRHGKLITHPSLSLFIDPALQRLAMTGWEDAVAFFGLPYEPAPQNVVPIRPGVYQPGRV